MTEKINSNKNIDKISSEEPVNVTQKLTHRIIKNSNEEVIENSYLAMIM